MLYLHHLLTMNRRKWIPTINFPDNCYSILAHSHVDGHSRCWLVFHCNPHHISIFWFCPFPWFALLVCYWLISMHGHLFPVAGYPTSNWISLMLGMASHRVCPSLQWLASTLCCSLCHHWLRRPNLQVTRKQPPSQFCTVRHLPIEPPIASANPCTRRLLCCLQRSWPSVFASIAIPGAIGGRHLWIWGNVGTI